MEEIVSMKNVKLAYVVSEAMYEQLRGYIYLTKKQNQEIMQKIKSTDALPPVYKPRNFTKKVLFDATHKNHT
jgi:hypothetical protein